MLPQLLLLLGGFLCRGGFLAVQLLGNLPDFQALAIQFSATLLRIFRGHRIAVMGDTLLVHPFVGLAAPFPAGGSRPHGRQRQREAGQQCSQDRGLGSGVHYVIVAPSGP